MITIVNYGLGNLGSIQNMLKYLGINCMISSDFTEIEKADKLILPGVGSFDKGMELLREKKVNEILNYKVLDEKIPILGICLGMQMMGNSSEEGKISGLGWINGRCIKFKTNSETSFNLKVPHMGWNYLRKVKDDRLFADMEDGVRFYFVHSYHLICDNPDDAATVTNYGYDFVSSFAKDNIFGVQFHPEKSHKFGMRLLNNFSKI